MKIFLLIYSIIKEINSRDRDEPRGTSQWIISASLEGFVCVTAG